MSKLWAITLILISLLHPALADSGKESGGGFEFYYADVDRVVRESQDLAVQMVRGWSEKVWRSSYFVKPVNREKLIYYIQNARFNKDKDLWRVNPAGEKDPIMMNYLEKEDCIEILAPTFREIKGRLNRYENLTDIRTDTARALVHESLHLFGYSENEAYRASRLVYGLEFVLDCDKVTARFSDFQCIFPTPDRLQRTRGLLEQWANNNGTQPYVIMFGDLDGMMLQVDLLTKFTPNTLGDIKTSDQGGDWKTGRCSGDIFPLLECSTKTDFIIDVSQTSILSFDPNRCTYSHECSEAFRTGTMNAYFRKKLKTLKKDLIFIKRK